MHRLRSSLVGSVEDRSSPARRYVPPAAPRSLGFPTTRPSPPESCVCSYGVAGSSWSGCCSSCPESSCSARPTASTITGLRTSSQRSPSPGDAMTTAGGVQVRVSDALGLERNIVAVSMAIFLLALGENLWKRFLPKYLEILGAPITVIGLFGTCEDFLDGVYQYPGGWISDRYGRRRALLLFVALAMVGYGLYWLAPSWPFVFAGLLFVMAWSSMASPPLFAVVGDALPKERRALGFTVQSILKRVPIAVAPTLGGLAIAEYGLRNGAHLGLGLTVGLAAIALIVLGRIDLPVKTDPVPTHIVAVWRSLPTALRWLLASDIFIRTCEGLVDVFLVLYAINVIGVSAPTYGLLVGVQMTTAIVSYLPVARVADRLGRKPFVIATFVAFALFPVAV